MTLQPRQNFCKQFKVEHEVEEEHDYYLLRGHGEVEPLTDLLYRTHSSAELLQSVKIHSLQWNTLILINGSNSWPSLSAPSTPFFENSSLFTAYPYMAIITEDPTDVST